MDRPLLYSMELARGFDLLSAYVDIMKALAQTAMDLMGGSTTMVTGLAATPTTPTASLSINLAAGSIYQLAAIDTNAFGILPANSAQILQQGIYAGGQVTLVTSALTTGQSQYALIQCEFAQLDAIRANDPNNGILPYYDSANPSVPLQGPLNSQATQNTIRQGGLSVQVIYGTPATTGTEVPPNPTTGWTPLYLVDLAYGQTQITAPEILKAGPSAGLNVPSNYPAMPSLAGFLNQHHLGTPGQAPQIDLTAEVQGVLPVANGGASASTPQSANTVNAGPATGSPTLPTYRALVQNDLPSPLSGNQTINQVMASPASGAAGPVTLRALVAADLPVSVLLNQQLFTAAGSTNWTAPAGVTDVWVTGVGGGGGGYGAAGATSAYGGGGAACAWMYHLTVVPGNVYAVVVGAHGTGGNTTPTDGGASSFGALLTIPGGLKGSNAAGGAGGSGTGLIPGTNGLIGNISGCKGGDSFLGMGSVNLGTSSSVGIWVKGAVYGGGGAPATSTSVGNLAGTNGADGIVILMW